MKLVRAILPGVIFFVASCASETPHFTVTIESTNDDTTYTYTLTDTLLLVTSVSPNNTMRWSQSTTTINASDLDTLRLISKLKPKSYDCAEQHALLVNKITFSSDSGTVEVDPNVNHPKEIDYTVRLLNRYVPFYLQLRFIDMQPAIEPDGKLRL